MKKEWFCVSCLVETDLDIHGRCSSCGSDAVDRVESRPILFDEQEDPRAVPVHSGPGLGRSTW